MSEGVGDVWLVGVAEADAIRDGIADGIGSGAAVRTLAREAALRELQRGGARPSVVAVAVGADSDAGQEQTLALVAALHAAIPAASIVVVALDKDPELILRAMRAGACEFVLASDLTSQIATLRARLGRPGVAGTLTAFVPARGGAGCTTLAANLGAHLALAGKKVCLVDLDFDFGDALLLCDLEPRFVISDVLANLDRLDGELLLSSLSRHRTGLYALAQTGRRAEAAGIGARDLPPLLEQLRRHFDHVLLDGVRGFGGRAAPAIEAADQVLLVCTQEIAAVKNARVAVTLLEELGCGPERTRLILNRAGQKAPQLDPEAVPDFVRLPVAARVANDFPVVSRAVASGRLVVEDAPRSQVSRDVAALSALVAARGPASEKIGTARRGLWESLWKRGASGEREAANGPRRAA